MRQPHAKGCGGREGPRWLTRDKIVKNLPPEKATDFSQFWHIQNCRRSQAYQLNTPVQGLRALPGGVGARSPRITPATFAPSGTLQCASPTQRGGGGREGPRWLTRDKIVKNLPP